MNNKKAFTVVELIIAFIFVMTISLSMLKLVLTYQKLSKEAILQQELSSFHEELMSTIQKDIRIKILKKIDRCPLKAGERYCLELKFQDSSSAKLKVIKYKNKDNEEFDIFEYDDIKYIPTEGYFTSINPKNEEYFKEVYLPYDNKIVYFINMSLIHEDFKNYNYGVNLVLTGINS